MRSSFVFLGLGLTAFGCGSSGGGGGKMPDAPNVNVPAMINISGTASERSLSGTTPVSGAVVAAYDNANPTTVVTMTTTDSMGKYTLMVPTNGKPVDGFVKATMSGYMDTYLYAPAPLTADFGSASINMLTPNEFDLLSNTLCGVTTDTTKGAIGVEVVDANMMTVAGATVSSSPAAAKYCYDSGSPSFPNKSATMTDSDGVVVMLQVTGSATLSASMSGATFKSHTVNAVAGAFTTTLITE